MRKVFKSFMLVAAAAMAFVSCQKEEVSAPETVSVDLMMHAGIEQTKTYLENNAVLWGKGESVTLYVGSGETAKFVDSASTDAYDGETSASFTFNITDVTEADSYVLGGIYPASAAMDDNTKPKEFKTILPQTQNAEVGKYDPSAYIMVLKPETVETLPTEYQASFRRATALNKITLTNVKEDITTVEITVPETKALAGRRYFDLTDGTSGEIYYGQSNTITVNSQFTGSSIDVWFCSWGVELAAGEELTVRMKNANKSFTRTIQAKETGIKFVEGDLNTLKIDMASANEESFESFAGEWLITGTAGEVTYALSPYSSGNNIKASVSITIENEVIEPVDGIESCKLLFTKISEGEYEGMYTIQDTNGKYLYAASSSGNHLKAGNSATSAHYYWTVESKDGKHSIVASKSSNRNVMQFNPNNGSPIFSCYASATQTAVVLYPYSMVKVDETPKIVVDETEKSIGAEGGELTFTYALKNLDGQNVSVTETSDFFVATASNGTVTVTVDPNEGDERTGVITLTCGEAVAVELTVVQEGKNTVPSGPQTITIADFLAKKDTETEYILTGKITSVANTSYGNFDLTDASGKVYVYGLLTPDGASQKQWAAAGLKQGDIITIKGKYNEYNNSPQVKNAVYVSHQGINVDNSILNFAAEGGSLEVTATLVNAADAVTVSVDNSHFNVALKSGTTYIVTAPANQTEENIYANLTFTAGELSAVVSITQTAPAPEDEIIGGRDDFNTVSTSTSYVTSTTTEGWKAVNCAVLQGGTTDSSPTYKFIGSTNATRAFCMNGKTSTVGSITSPTLTTGCGTLKFNYGLPFSDTKIKFRVDIKQNGTVVKTFTIDNSSASKVTKYSHEEVVNVSGDFQIIFTNLSPSNSTSNKDRTAVWDIEWTGYAN